METYKYKEKNGVIYDKNFSSYDWLKVVDKVITDYSSLAMETALLDIPIYFYTYDIEEYKQNPGLNFDFETEEIGKYATFDVECLLKKIEEDYGFQILEKFKNKYISIEKQNCTKQLINLIVEEMYE